MASSWLARETANLGESQELDLIVNVFKAKPSEAAEC